MDEANLTHPDRTQLESFVHGMLSDGERQRVESHVAECDSCCEILRAVPHDALVERMRAVDTSSSPGETRLMSQTGAEEQKACETGIPPELVKHPRYRIAKQLGAGGMGVVYQAEHRLMERPVALKVIRGRLISSDVAVERFRLEVKAAAKLSHRNIVAAFDAEQAGDLHFLVMEFIEGTSLSELVERRGQLSVLHACNYIMQAAHGLQHALEKGMVHRDIKPQNLMRTPKGTIKILDFGLARFASQRDAETDDAGLTNEGVTLGTPDYIAPEQARSARRADIRADIYSLGCTLYYLLVGQVPFPSGTAIDKVVSHCQHDPTPLSELRNDIPDEVIRIVERMMAKDPAKRFQTPSEVVEALKPFGKPRASAEVQATIDTTLATSAEKPAAQNTCVDLSPTLPPLGQLEPFEIRQAEQQTSQKLPAQLTGPRPATDWRQWLQRHRVPLATGTVVISLLVAFMLLLPIARDTVARLGSGNGGENNPSGESSIPEVSQLPPPAADGWIDLLSQVDASQHAVAGQWLKTDDGLTIEANGGASLMLPYELPAEYDYEVTFTRNTGSDSLALHFVAGEGQASFDIDGWYQHLAGIQNIDGRTTQANETRVENQKLLNGRTYTAMVRVRRGRVDAYLDGRRLTTYHGDGSNLSLLDLWQLPDSRAIGIGAYNSTTTFHRIRVRSVVDD